jgi:hypothetical protein
MVKTEFVEDAYDHAADFVAATARKGNRLDEHVQRLFVVTRVERRESPPEVWHPGAFEPDPGRQAIGDEAPMNVLEDLERLLVLPAAVQDAGELDGSVGVPRLELQGCA